MNAFKKKVKNFMQGDAFEIFKKVKYNVLYLHDFKPDSKEMLEKPDWMEMLEKAETILTNYELNSDKFQLTGSFNEVDEEVVFENNEKGFLFLYKRRE